MTDRVPTVKPTNLKSLWRIVDLFQAVSPSGSLGSRTLEEASSEGADIEATNFSRYDAVNDAGNARILEWERYSVS
jgi:hypothetical protein